MILGFEYGGQKEEYRVHKELRELSPLAFLKFVEIINKPEINGQDAREFMHLAYGIKMLYLDQITELKLIELLNEIGVFKEERVCGKVVLSKTFFSLERSQRLLVKHMFQTVRFDGRINGVNA